MYVQDIADVDLRQHAVNSEFIVVFAQTARHIVLVVARCVLLAEHGDVVVGAVHRRAHKVSRARVKTYVFLVYVLFVDSRGDKRTVGREHVSAQLGVDLNVAHTRGHKYLLEFFANALAYYRDIVLAVLGLIVNAYAAREVDELDMHAGLFVQANRKLEKNRRELGIIIVGNSV